MKNEYKGVVVPMVTPVTDKGEIDRQAVTRIMELFTARNISPLLMGTTGEGNSVSKAQSEILVKTAAEAGKGRVVIYACLNGCCTAEHIEYANRYHKLGADVIVATLPSYYALTDEQIYDYYKTLADNITAPLMLYNIKATTHMSIPLEIVARLMEHPHIVGLKDSERDEERMQKCLEMAAGRDDFAYFIGWAAQCANALKLGADGIVPSTGNFVPEMFADLYKAALAGNHKEAQRLQQETDAIAKIYQADKILGQSLAALKVMMKTRGLCEPHMLSPLTRLSAEMEAEVIEKTSYLSQ
ncbi:MAG: dihydrodipicolinate synthase family protein [Bacteroides sp.]|nr:dihydrodipicolinate synthase family protein [Bacteroides sp.]